MPRMWNWSSGASSSTVSVGHQARYGERGLDAVDQATGAIVLANPCDVIYHNGSPGRILDCGDLLMTVRSPLRPGIAGWTKSDMLCSRRQIADWADNLAADGNGRR